MKIPLQSVESLLISSFLGALLLFLTPSLVFGKDINLSTGVGIEYATGQYGTGVTTDALTIPLTVRYEPANGFDLELIVPYIYQSNGTTTFTGMFRFRSGRSDTSSNGAGSGGQGSSPVKMNSDLSRAQNGIGDVSLKAGYIVWPEGKYSPHIQPLVYVKFPTGDDNKGLGTGTFTEGVGIELAKWFGDWYSYAEGIYNFQDTSTELALKDFLSYEAGVAYQMTDRFQPAILLKGVTAPSEYSSALAEVRCKTIYRLTGRASLEGYLATGLTDSSSDFGAGFSVFYDF